MQFGKFQGRGLYFGVSGLTEKCQLSFVNTLNALTQLWLCLGVRFDLNILFYAQWILFGEIISIVCFSDP